MQRTLKEVTPDASMPSVYNFNGLDITVQKDGDEIWFRGKDVVEALGYRDPDKAIRDHVRDRDRKKVMQAATRQNGGLVKSRTHLINEPGVYSLVFRSKLPIAEEFQDWVFRDVLPSIRKTGQYIEPRLIGNQLSLMNETDLHYQVISYIRKYHTNAVVIPGLGENQDTSSKRIVSWKKGYRSGQPDIIIGNLHKTYSGLAIELKTPNGMGDLSDKQKSFIGSLGDNGYRVLVSCNYDEIHRCIDEYMTEARVRCRYCGRKFRNKCTLSNHCKYFHRTLTKISH